ncbi:MAG: hypothetical protein LBT89_07910 [Planctomycetaceae bacterium]|jgi:xylulokinase|nr:hypothetical protein [Planctomycetaceae bacterium]
MLLGIDLGSTSVKAVLYDTAGNAAAQDSTPMRRFHPSDVHPEWTVWEPAALWDDVAAVCRNVISAAGNAAVIKGIAVTGMGVDGLPMTDDGTALYPLISWLDPRTEHQYEWWMNNIGSEITYRIGGNPVWAMNSACRMLWIKENEPDIFRRTYKWLLIEDFINYRLTGRFATDYSMASYTMLFDKKRRCWSDELSRLADIPAAILPEILPSSSFLGTVTAAAAKKTALKEGTPVYLGGNDHICSSLPVGAFREGCIMNITGTWETVCLVSPTPPEDTALGESGIMTQANVLSDRYTIWGGNPAGEMIEWYRRSVAAALETKQTPDWDALIAAAQESPPGCGGVMFLPHLDGCKCPWVDPRSRGAFIGLNTRTSHSEMFRSVIEGLGYQILTVIRLMEASVQMQAAELIATGGGTRNRFWMQNKADMTGLRVRIPAVGEATVLGAAILAGIGAGVYRDAEDAFVQVGRTGETLEPNEKLTAFYNARLPLFRSLYEATAPLHRQNEG